MVTLKVTLKDTKNSLRLVAFSEDGADRETVLEAVEQFATLLERQGHVVRVISEE